MVSIPKVSKLTTFRTKYVYNPISTYFIGLGVSGLRVEFDRQCSTERRHDPLTIIDGAGHVVAVRSGREWSDWSSELRIPGMEMMFAEACSLNL